MKDGNINTTVIGPYEKLKVRLPGSGGKRLRFIMLEDNYPNEQDKQRFVEKLGLSYNTRIFNRRARPSLGLGTCWLTMFDKNKLRALLKIPIDIDIIGVITVGYPKEMPNKPETAKRYGGKPRHDLKEIVFYEKYGELKP